MLQIVIYKKINFWEEYTPLHSSAEAEEVGALGFEDVDLPLGRLQTPSAADTHLLHQDDGSW